MEEEAGLDWSRGEKEEEDGEKESGFPSGKGESRLEEWVKCFTVYMYTMKDISYEICTCTYGWVSIIIFSNSFGSAVYIANLSVCAHTSQCNMHTHPVLGFPLHWGTQVSVTHMHTHPVLGFPLHWGTQVSVTHMHTHPVLGFPLHWGKSRRKIYTHTTSKVICTSHYACTLVHSRGLPAFPS